MAVSKDRYVDIKMQWEPGVFTAVSYDGSNVVVSWGNKDEGVTEPSVTTPSFLERVRLDDLLNEATISGRVRRSHRRGRSDGALIIFEAGRVREEAITARFVLGSEDMPPKPVTELVDRLLDLALVQSHVVGKASH